MRDRARRLVACRCEKYPGSACSKREQWRHRQDGCGAARKVTRRKVNHVPVALSTVSGLAILLNLVLDAAFLCVTVAYVLLAPFTKVEESFNLHALHDVLMHGVLPNALAEVRHVNVCHSSMLTFRNQYDHFTFPGAVPRSFIGSLGLASVSSPVLQIGATLGAIERKIQVQIVGTCPSTNKSCFTLRSSLYSWVNQCCRPLYSSTSRLAQVQSVHWRRFHPVVVHAISLALLGWPYTP